MATADQLKITQILDLATRQEWGGIQPRLVERAAEEYRTLRSQINEDSRSRAEFDQIVVFLDFCKFGKWSDANSHLAKAREELDDLIILLSNQNLAEQAAQSEQRMVDQRYVGNTSKVSFQNSAQRKPEGKSKGAKDTDSKPRSAKSSRSLPQSIDPRTASVGDMISPAKIAESFTDLYETEWKDAHQELVQKYKMDEEQAVGDLLDIVKSAYSLCKRQAEKMFDNLSNSAVSVFTFKDDKLFKDAKASLPFKSSVNLLRQVMKEMSPLSVPKITQGFEVEMTKSHRSPMVKRFARACAELCWYMCVQDPPIYLVTVERGTPIDTEMFKYKSFSKSGKIVRFCEWPALLFRDYGPVLCKGNVRGR